MATDPENGSIPKGIFGHLRRFLSLGVDGEVRLLVRGGVVRAAEFTTRVQNDDVLDKSLHNRLAV